MKIQYDKIPTFGQYAEYVTQKPTIVDGNIIAEVEVHRIPISQFLEGDNIEQTMTALEGDYQKLADIRPAEAITEADKNAMAEKYHADIVAYATQDMDTLKVIEKLKEISSYPAWREKEAVKVGMVRMYAKNLYTVLQAHTTQSDWTPDKVPALWKKFYTADVIPDWVQPTGAHDAYNKGDKVLYNGVVYQSLIDANVWSPSAYPAGWTK